MITRLNRAWVLCFMLVVHTGLYAAVPIFQIQLAQSSTGFPSTVGLYDAPIEYVFTVTNQSARDMPSVFFVLPASFIKNTENSTCGTFLRGKKSCQLALTFRPTQLGRFSGQLKICGGNGTWCSLYPQALDVTVTKQDIVSTNCSQIKSRPFSDLTCQGSQQFAGNFRDLMTQVLQTAPTHSAFKYFQHVPSPNETTTPCLEARQPNVGLDANIQGGGGPLCQLMGYAASSADPEDEQQATGLSKQFPPYLTRLMGTSFPITPNTTPLDQLSALLQDFNTGAMNDSVRHVGYTGHVNFLTQVYQEQLSKTYGACGISINCPSIFYLPYQLTSGQEVLEQWPPSMAYWGSSGGGGAGFEIRAFRPGSSTHYTLFSGGGGGGAGSTTPEGLESSMITLLNTGSGGGGGSQFADCYLNAGDNLGGLGLGAGTGAGLSTLEGSDVVFNVAPQVNFSFLKPASHPTWDNQAVLTTYADNLERLFNTLIPQLYAAGYTVALTGGGGGGTGLEFLNEQGQEFTPHALSIGYGFNFCYLFNKNNKHDRRDCISAPTANIKRLTINNIIYQNLGKFFDEGMRLAILPKNCNGYANYACTCPFQYNYVITQLSLLLKAYGFTEADIPVWLMNSHCGNNQVTLFSRTSRMDRTRQANQFHSNMYMQTLQKFYQVNHQNTCIPPWD